MSISSAPLQHLSSRFASAAKKPLYRNAYALLISTSLSSGLGVVYWIVAARYYSASALGWNAALISVMILLSGISQLNLMSAMIRFIPRAGQGTGRLVGSGYLITVLLSLGMGLLFVLGARTWGLEHLAPVGHLALFLWFLFSTMVWGIFALQDNVLTGLRQTVWVPVENIVYAVAKIVLLVVLAGRSPEYGIFLSWTVPVVLAILPVNYLIFRRLIPQHVRSTAGQEEPLVVSKIARFVAGNYVGSLMALASARFLPVLVTTVVGATANAYFYMAWTITNSLHLIATNMTMSLTVEGAADAIRLRARGARFLLHLLGLLGPAVLVVLVIAPYILRLSGSEYAAQGTMVFRLMALATLPHIVNALYISVARVQSRSWAVARVQGGYCVITLLLSYLLLPHYGITGVGWALLIAESLVAGLVLTEWLWPLLSSPSAREQFGRAIRR